MNHKRLIVAVGTCVLLLLTFAYLLTPKEKAKPEAAFNPLSFDQLKEEIDKQNWKIEAEFAADGSAETIVLFYDAHIPAIEELNYRRILKLEEIWNLEIVLLENIAVSPDSPDNLRMRSLPLSALEVDPKAVLTLRGEGAEELPQLSPSSGIYQELFKRNEFDAYGFEDPVYFAKVAPAAIGEEIYDQMLEVSMRKFFMPVRKGDKTIYQILELLAVQEYLNNQFEGYPVFDPNKLSMQKNDTIVLSGEDSSYVGECAFMHRAWMLKYACYPRNKIAVERSLKRMRAQQQTRAALVIGGDHLKHHNLVDGKSVLDWLEESGVSYLLVVPQ